MTSIPLYEHVLNVLSMIVLTSLSLYLFIRLMQRKKREGEIHMISLIIFIEFLLFTYLAFIEFFFQTFPPINELPNAEEMLGKDSDYFSLYNLGVGLMVMFGIMMMASIFKSKILLTTPVYLFGSLLFMYYYAGITVFTLPYLYGGAIVAVAVFYYIGLKIQDNGALTFFFLTKKTAYRKIKKKI